MYSVQLCDISSADLVRLLKRRCRHMSNSQNEIAVNLPMIRKMERICRFFTKKIIYDKMIRKMERICRFFT